MLLGIRHSFTNCTKFLEKLCSYGCKLYKPVGEHLVIVPGETVT